MFVTVEGDLDSVVITKILASLDIKITRVDAEGGKHKIRPKIEKILSASLQRDWMVLIDLDNGTCAGELVEEWCYGKKHNAIFRVAVREIESWLLADHVRAAHFLGVSQELLPANCDGIENPKEFLVSLAGRSRTRAIREGLVPRLGSGRTTGPQYTAMLSGFAQGNWDPQTASQRSDSLARCLRALEIRFCANARR